jgi:xanthine dehydrogenase small subunit
MRNKIIFYLNGKKQEIAQETADMMLADYLRYRQCLTGTKVVCAEGDCGACSVLRYIPYTNQGDNPYLPINSCIAPLTSLDGSSLVTVDALKGEDELHEVQKSMIKCHGSQCGFCTPGFVMALTGLVEEKLEKSETVIAPKEAKNCMTGNLCRCTGYAPIVDAATKIDLKNCITLKSRFYSKEQDDVLKSAYQEEVKIETSDFIFYAPKNTSNALSYLSLHPDIKIIASGTDLGVVHNKRKIKLQKLLSLHLIEELYELSQTADEIYLGARVTHTDFRNFMKDKSPEISLYLDIFASPQIKNSATVVGNVATASPIGDTPPLFLALNAEMIIATSKGDKVIPISDFFLSYRKTQLASNEFIKGIKFKLPKGDFKLFKNSNRKDLDISAVNLAINVEWKDQHKKSIQKVTMAAGGVAAVPLRLKKTEDYLQANPTDIDGAIKILHTEFTPMSDLRASAAYRHVLVENFVRRFFEETSGAV